MKKDNEQIKNISLKEISPNPYQPRIHFDSTKLLELAQSIKENGLLQPIIVRKSHVFGYQILAGERRFRAFEMLGLPTIPAVIRQLEDQEMMILSILENLQRDDMTALEEAKSYKNLSDKAKMTHQEIASKLGKSRPYVSNMIRILQLPETILEMIENKSISPGHARVLLALDDEAEQERVARLVLQNKISVRELEKLISKDKLDSKNNPLPKNIFIDEIEERLAQKFGSKIQIKTNKHNKGEIKISFNNLDELNRLIEDLLS
ncbi:ParB/RepB/Spo0J family partition protein [Streptococcaceae bacterium ESL0729]|nr:ParB/RepB/Spo0J family partition protein [Streptococcaceae bacterium ESL0729]